jgi:energy-coupling factor transporter ATP-binding protein EcfA2
LAIAGILAMRPECIILDEPFANLDMESVNEVTGLCRDFASAGMTVIVVTHELEKILGLATRLLILDRGSLVFDGPPADATPELFRAHGLACPWEGHFPWTMPRPSADAADAGTSGGEAAGGVPDLRENAGLP